MKDAVPAVKRWCCEKTRRWLFLFDSADHVEHTHDPLYVNLQYFLPDDPSVDVTVTTRNANVRKMGPLDGVEVAEMTAKEEMTLFLK